MEAERGRGRRKGNWNGKLERGKGTRKGRGVREGEKANGKEGGGGVLFLRGRELGVRRSSFTFTVRPAVRAMVFRADNTKVRARATFAHRVQNTVPVTVL